ncbi:2-octaprenylphenol hydroxylase [Rhizorhabdus wittichii RW1]|uniref:2-octaprenylphenol hydroxylase n=2 Tax=Rhizorhabdus wittichii TaxID=160791 RepID=A0A9J9HG95_RHIWR|nr:AarF/UbiB family protein [Rhizorhabdus wittichii]ABQ71101.1 2-octaprenylphenol hydroxylase [Rhizorhabdus wittichii RW1]QTH22179.1 AarF/ABC1/UbiB kinase family protein [Rhizorhabdus wittichii]
MLGTMRVAARDRGRLAEIVGVVSRFGLQLLLRRIGLSLGDGGTDGDDLPRRARQAMEALGPTFVKLGQILATRGDLLPPAWIAELEMLHSQAPTLPFDRLRPAVEAALGEAPETAFASFDTEPLAAASIAQVHRATLPDGRAVAVKIRRPDIRPRMEADLRLLVHFAGLIEGASAEARRWAPSALVRHLAEAVLAELDFTHEGRNADRLREDFAGHPGVVIPAIHWELTSETLLVMDFVSGVPPRDAASLVAQGIDPAAIADLGADVVLDMILVNGRFHADPHPGNLLCLPGNRIALLDLGMIGHVSPLRREEFVDFVRAIAGGDAASLAAILRRWSVVDDIPAAAFRRAADRLVERHGGTRIVLKAMIADIFALMREERLVLPPDLVLIFKALVTIDGVLSAIEPDYDLSAAIARAGARIAIARLDPDRWTGTVRELLWELGRAGDDAPRLLRAALRRLDGEAEPARPADPSAAIAAAGGRIAIALFLGLALIAGAVLLG